MIKKIDPEYKASLIELIRLNTPAYFDAAEEEDFIVYLDTQTEDYFVVERDNKVVGCGGINYEFENKTAVI